MSVEDSLQQHVTHRTRSGRLLDVVLALVLVHIAFAVYLAVGGHWSAIGGTSFLIPTLIMLSVAIPVLWFGLMATVILAGVCLRLVPRGWLRVLLLVGCFGLWPLALFVWATAITGEPLLKFLT